MNDLSETAEYYVDSHTINKIMENTSQTFVGKKWQRQDGSYIDVKDMNNFHLRNAKKVALRKIVSMTEWVNVFDAELERRQYQKSEY